MRADAPVDGPEQVLQELLLVQFWHALEQF
jgi:hypothetical protein